LAVPRTASFCAPRPVLSVMVRFVLIVAPAGARATSLNLSTTVQLAPGARTAAAPVQLLVAMLKYRVVRLPLPPLPAAGNVTAVIVTLALPAGATLVSVTVPRAVLFGYTVPARYVTVSRGVGVAATLETPVPMRVTGEPVTVPFEVIVTDPLAGPLAVGENLTRIVQFAPTASVVVQLPPLRLNGAVTATLMPVNPTAPVLVSVSVWFALFVPVRVLAKVSEVGATLADAVIVPASSTAPMSNPVPCGRGLPKKSLVGAATPLAVPVPTFRIGGVVVE